MSAGGVTRLTAQGGVVHVGALSPAGLLLHGTWEGSVLDLPFALVAGAEGACQSA